MKPAPHALPVSAAWMIVGATLCFALLDSVIKLLSQRYPVLVLVWGRWTVQVVALLAWLAPQVGVGLVRTRRPGMQLLRGALLMGSSVCFMSALKYLPLADATAINYSTPVVVSVMAVVFLNERMTRLRIAFVVVGIVGMLMIVRPGSEVFRGASLLALCAAGFYATFQVMTRTLAREDWRVSLFIPALVSSGVLTAALPFLDWPASIAWTDAILLVAASLFGTYGHYLFLRAFQQGSASALTPYTYTQLVWATLIGWGLFRTFPDGWTIAGMAVIAASGLLIMLHEHRRSRAGSPPREPAAVD